MNLYTYMSRFVNIYKNVDNARKSYNMKRRKQDCLSDPSFLFQDLALKLKDVLHYQPLCENHMWYYHLNFTAKTKEDDGFDSTSDNLFFVEVKCMGKGNYEEMVVSCFCVINPIDNGIEYFYLNKVLLNYCWSRYLELICDIYL